MVEWDSVLVVAILLAVFVLLTYTMDIEGVAASGMPDIRSADDIAAFEDAGADSFNADIGEVEIAAEADVSGAAVEFSLPCIEGFEFG